MDNNIHSVTLNSCYITPTEVEEAKKHFLDTYNVSGKFFDGGDQYSTWTLTGHVENLRQAIKEEWLCRGYLGFLDVISNPDELKLFMTEEEIKLSR